MAGSSDKDRNVRGVRARDEWGRFVSPSDTSAVDYEYIYVDDADHDDHDDLDDFPEEEDDDLF